MRAPPLVVLGAIALAGIGAIVLAASVSGGGHPPDRAAEVARAYNESRGTRYSFGGGHTAWGVVIWPIGGRGKRGGIGWDCSGYFLGVVRRSSSPPEWAAHDSGTTELFKHLGSPRNGLEGAKPGYAIVWGDNGIPTHIGFYLGDGMAVSALGTGSETNGDNPAQVVRIHSIEAAGMPVIGTAPW